MSVLILFGLDRIAAFKYDHRRTERHAMAAATSIALRLASIRRRYVMTI